MPRLRRDYLTAEAAARRYHYVTTPPAYTVRPLRALRQKAMMALRTARADDQYKPRDVGWYELAAFFARNGQGQFVRWMAKNI